MTTGKTIALTRRTFVGKVMSLLFNILSKLVIAFLPRSKHLLISWLQSPTAVILEPKKIKYVTVFIVSPSISHKVMGMDAIIFDFWIFNFNPSVQFSSVTQSCPTLCDPVDCSPPGSSVHVIYQARILEWVAMPSSRDLLNPGIEPRSPTLQVDSFPS